MRTSFYKQNTFPFMSNVIKKDFARQDELRERMDRFYEMTFLAERPLIALDLIRMVCDDGLSGWGSRIGGGASRAVYDFPFIPGTVIKITADPAANSNEWEIWKCVKKHDNYKKWFAPCLHISPTGHFLIQKKCRKIRKTDKLPKQLPSIFADVKISNWGYIGKQLVCHDFQFIDNAVFAGMASTMPAKWNYENGF